MNGRWLISRKSRCIGLLILLCQLLNGCGSPPVIEDRRINFSQDGQSVSFQHGLQGVYVADPKTGKPLKVFETEATTIAVSTPLWSPVDQRLIFATARPQPQADTPDQIQAENPLTNWNINPDGVRYQVEPIIYSCWLRPAAAVDAIVEPELLFEAQCDHPGYVGANLAIRWHPDGNQVLFIDEANQGSGLGLFSFDVTNRVKSQQFALPASDAILFDWTPDQSRLVVLSARSTANKENGIWIGDRALNGSWWRVPGSEGLGQGNAYFLQTLRGALPAFSHTGNQFLFAIPKKQPAEDEKIERTIFLCDVQQKSVSSLVDVDSRVRSLQWRPDGQAFGYLSETGVAGDNTLELRRLGDVNNVVASIPAVRDFVGWDSTGAHLAFVAAEPLERATKKHWALLLIPDSNARQRVYLANSDGAESKLVFDKMHIAFPQWSPANQRLSLWGTFMPKYRSILSLLGSPLALRPGDPAFVLDPNSGQFEWLAVDPHEKAQVGNYFLLKRDYDSAWKWYEEARKQRATQPPSKVAESVSELFRNRANESDPTFFEYICLTKLGRTAEAEERLREFREKTRTQLKILEAEQPTGAQDNAARDETATPQNATLGSQAIPFVQDLFIAEAFLSQDLLEDGIAFLRQELDQATTDGERLAHSSVLSQLLLIAGNNLEYVRLLNDTWVPAILNHKPRFENSAGLNGNPLTEQMAYVWFGGAVLAPLLSSEFVAELPEDVITDMVTKWTQYRERAKDDLERFAADIVLLSAANRLGQKDQNNAIAVRLKASPLAAQWLGNNDVETFMKQFEQGFEDDLQAVGWR